MLFGPLFAIGNMVAPRSDATSLALVFPPGTSFPEVTEKLMHLDARVMRIGAAENIVIVRFFNDWSLADLWHSGAWIALRARAVGDCLNASPQSAPFS